MCTKRGLIALVDLAEKGRIFGHVVVDLKIQDILLSSPMHFSLDRATRFAPPPLRSIQANTEPAMATALTAAHTLHTQTQISEISQISAFLTRQSEIHFSMD